MVVKKFVVILLQIIQSDGADSPKLIKVLDMATSFYSGLDFSTREINMNFKIKVFGFNENGKKINTLVGVAGLIDLIGMEMANKMFARAFRSMEDKQVCKLRRGIKVTFYIH